MKRTILILFVLAQVLLLADAVEVLRKKVVEKVEQWCNGDNEAETGPIYRRLCGCIVSDQTTAILLPPIDRFMIFAAALGGVTQEGK